MPVRPLLLSAVLAAAICSVPSLCLAAEKAPVEDISLSRTITTALDASAAAWTRGDLDDFMRLYEDSPEIRYINDKGMTQGYAGIRAMYAARFAKGEPMGELSIALIEVKQTGADYAFVTGRFTLKQASGKVATGLTTLLFHRAAGQWRIVSDHTS
jgi:ketosteroid isomerase-like protein